MSNINLNTNNSGYNPNVAIATNASKPPKLPTEPDNSDAAKFSSEIDNVKVGEYGPVIAKSSDGDTVRVKSNDFSEQSGTYTVGNINTPEKNEKIPEFDLPPSSTIPPDRSSETIEKSEISTDEDSIVINPGAINNILSGNISDSIPIEIRMQALQTLDNM